MGRPHREINVIRGKRLKELIEDQGMTQKEFEKEIHLSQQSISNIINGHAHLTDEIAKEIIYIHQMQLEACFQYSYLEKMAVYIIFQINLHI